MRNIEGIKIVDATIRDGGLVNDFFFKDEFVKKVYESNVAAGVDYMEFGYRADKKMFDPSKFGKWKFASDDDIYRIVGDNPTGLKLCVMADVGRCDFKNDIHKKSESPLSLIRVATYIETIPVPQQITGYEYQFIACRQALIDGLLEPKEMSLDETLYIMQLMDDFRQKWGVKYPMDNE